MRDAGIAEAAPTVAAVVHPGQRELDIGESLPGAGGDRSADLVQCSCRIRVHRVGSIPGQPPPVLVMSREMGELFIAEISLPLELFAQGG
jgi:hypothetical protein